MCSRLFHLNLLLVSFLVNELRLDSASFLRLLRGYMGSASLSLALLLVMIKPFAISFLPQLNMLILGLRWYSATGGTHEKHSKTYRIDTS